MSDGISDAYRNHREGELFDKKFASFLAEYCIGIYEPIKKHIDSLSTGQMLEEIKSQCSKFSMTYFSKKYGYDGDNAVELMVCFSDMQKFIRGATVDSVLIDAIMFIEFCKTDEGRRAIEEYD